jgi:predicted RNA-binding Zn ribbon-like protein
MDFTHYTDWSVDFAVELTNTYGAHGVGGPASSISELHALLPPEATGFAKLSETDVPAVRRLADRLYAAFTAPDSTSAARVLNALLSEADALPQLVNHDDQGWHMHFVPAGATPIRLLVATTAMGLAIVVSEDGIDRFGICNEAGCADAYVDVSRNRSRRYCSATCSNRANVAAHRARRRRQTDPAG